MKSHGPGSATTRRALLGGLAGLGTTSALPTAAARTDDLRVVTRNLYVGVDLFGLAAASDLDDVRRIAGRLLADVREHPYEARIDAIAAELAATAPDVVGLQEAVLIRTRQPSEFDGDHDPGATDVVVDLLELLREALEARDLGYEVAASTVTSDVELPAEVGDGEVDVRVTDRTAVLVREGMAVEDARSGRFEAAFSVPLEGLDIALERGFCSVDVTVDGTPATAATTHLEAIDPGVRSDQAEELLERLPTDRPVVLPADLNSGPGGPTTTYGRLRESFDDPIETLRDGADAYTCCHDPDLGSDAGALTRRYDVVLYRGALRPTDVRLVGTDPDERVTTRIDGAATEIWPSDHAGVVATFEFGAATDSTRTAMPTRTTAVTDGDRPDPQSGMGLVAAAAALVAAALARRREGE